MFGISFAELVVIAFAFLLIVGPNELPVVLNKLGKFVGEIKRIANEFMDAIKAESESPKKYIRDLKGNLQETYDIEDLLREQDKQLKPQNKIE